MGRQGTPRTDASRASLAHRVGAYVSAHRLRRRWLALMGVLAAVVVVVTAGALTMPASTMTADVATLPEGASVPEGYTQQYTAKDEANGIIVTAYAPEGVVPEGATLKASLLAQDSDEYVAAKQATGATDEEGAGFAAMDISFVDVDGNEVEPTGDVYVNIDAAGILPEDADPESVVVQHLAEDESGAVASVDTVADAADATEGVATAVDTSNVRAAFSVDGFSKFTITWSELYGYAKYFNVTVHYIDEDGNEIGPDDLHEDISISEGQTEVFSNYVKDIEGYSFTDSIKYVRGDQPYSTSLREVKSMVASSSGGGRNKKYNLSFYNSEDSASSNYLVDTLSCSIFEPTNQTAQIYLVYEKNETTGPGTGGGSTGGDEPTVVENATVTTSKTAYLKDDGSGNYDLTLSISGDRGSQSRKAAVDVLFIVDRSGSMTSTRQSALEGAVNTLITTLQGEKYRDNIDVQYGVVAFAGSKEYETSRFHDYGTVTYGWTSAGDDVYNWIDNLSYEGGTNYQQAIYSGKQMLANRDADRKENATTFVIFISDGIPTYRGVDVTNSTESWAEANGNGENDNDGKNIAAAVDEINSMSCDYFYAIGMGSDFGQEQVDGHWVDGHWENGHWENGHWEDGELVDKAGTTNLKALANAVNATYKGDNNVYSADDEDLSGAFGDITANITFFAAKDVTITDPLSNYADLVLTNGAPQFTINVTREAGEDVTGGTWSDTVSADQSVTFQDTEGKDQTATARVSEDNRTIYLDLPDDYELEPGYTYSVSTVITPSQAAITAGMNSDEAKNTPDPGTGTHADKNEQGFWSNVNENAKVTFTANGAAGSESFPKPVIRVPATGSLTINKDVEGATLSGVHSYEFTITTTTDMTNAHATYGDNATQLSFSKADNIWSASLSVSASNADDGEHNGSVTISGLPVGEYTVTESTDDDSVEFAHYEFDGATYSSRDVASDSPDTNGDVTVSGSQTAEVTVTNKYTAHQQLTVHKTSDQDGAPLEGASFRLYRFVLGPDGKPTENKEFYKESTTGEVTTASWEAETSATVKTSGTDGNLTFSDLDTNQTYYLVETSAPDGYVQLDKEIAISWNSDKDCWTAQYVGGGDDLFDSTTDEVIVTNSTGMALPSTGGSGTTIGTIGGVILVATAVCGYGLRRRHEGRGARS